MRCRSSFLAHGTKGFIRKLPVNVLIVHLLLSLRNVLGFVCDSTPNPPIAAFQWCQQAVQRGDNPRIVDDSTTMFRILSSRLYAQPTPEESARQLTEFMAKAHEEKLRALKTLEDKYRNEIADLKQRLERYESQEGAALATTQRQANSFEFPATNKAMGEKIKSYQKFLAEYLVKSQDEKLLAVSTAERKMKERYELIIAEIKEKHDTHKP